jgi:hypothetical protein
MEWRVRRRHSVALILVSTVIRPRQIRACARIQATIGRHQTRAVIRLCKLNYPKIPYLVSDTALGHF